MCDENNGKISCDKFMAGCSRFGLDSPCPTITKRLHCYGNSEDVDNDFKRILTNNLEKHPTVKEIVKIDPNVHQVVNFRGEKENDEEEDTRKKNKSSLNGSKL